ncbi:unnamed protein product [Enterobius vermicularis]|uniref:Helicase ATP-binding domain-containing protein n=1 Tax=Enterobius vermicularis TaxID=51028 RepID=A0A0N4UV62_ENTVE|nr:unnamed protein product [Enterobius vermicularis]
MVNRGNEIPKTFFSPRDHQVELLEKARKGNVIVPLGTGTGKTFIAVLLIKDHTAVLTDPSGKKKAFFLVDKVSIVEQQAQHIECHTVLCVGRIHGSRNADAASSLEKFNKFICNYEVVVSTAQIFLNVLDHGFIHLEDIALLVLDECHHVLGKNHPYRRIMHRYKNCSEDKRPKVLGLTASLINDKTPSSKLRQLISQLESIMCSDVVTASDIVSISKYGPSPKEFVIVCEDSCSVNSNEGVLLINTLRLNDEYDTKLKILLFIVIFQPYLIINFINFTYMFSEAVQDFCLKSREFNSEFEIDPRKQVLEAVRRTLSVLKQMGCWCAWKVCQFFQKQLKKHSLQKMLPEKQMKFLMMGETAMYQAKKLLDKKVFLVLMRKSKKFQ